MEQQFEIENRAFWNTCRLFSMLKIKLLLRCGGLMRLGTALNWMSPPCYLFNDSKKWCRANLWRATEEFVSSF